MNKLEEIILETVKYNIPVTIKWKDDKLMYEIPGFSKCGTVDLYYNSTDDIVFAEQRYNRRDELYDFRSLVHLAYCWWLDYKDRSPFENPDSYWKQLMVDYGFLNIENKQIEIYS